MTIHREQVTQALRDVLDPELGMSVVDLGLIYDVQIDVGHVRITMTLTTQGCPLHDAMTEWVRRAIEKVPGVDEVEVAITFEPPWTPERIGQIPIPSPAHSARCGGAPP
jgi:metal-sulfur cluster biosynthetic enzyme